MAVSESTLTKGMPCNLEAERAVLGAILLDNSAYNQAAQLLLPDDFFLPSNRVIFFHMTELLEESHPVDLVTLSEFLNRTNQLDGVGGPTYISSLTDGLPRLSNIEHYAT